MDLRVLAGLVPVAVVLTALVGCGGSPAAPPKGDAKGEPKKTVAVDTKKTDTPEPAPAKIEPAKPVMPTVILSEEDAATCLVKVGDALPEIKLADLEGKEQALKDLSGTKGTVVVFWSHTNPYAEAALGDLTRDAAEYADKGIKVVGVHKGDKDAGATAVKDFKVTFPNLADVDGAVLAKVSTKKLPRIYLLDSAGKILWFEMSYDSTNTNRTLQQALQFVTAGS